QLAVGGVEREHLPLDRQLARGLTNNDLVFHDERRASEVTAALLGVEWLGGPGFLAGPRVEGNDPPVERAHEDLAVTERHAAVVGLVEEGADDGIELRIVMPELLARGAVEREHPVVGGAVVDDPVDGDRGAEEALLDPAGLMDPRDLKPRNVVAGDLGEGAVAVPAVAPMVHRPVVGIRRHQGSRPGGLRGRDGRDERRQRAEYQKDRQPRCRSLRESPSHRLTSPLMNGPSGTRYPGPRVWWRVRRQRNRPGTS